MTPDPKKLSFRSEKYKAFVREHPCVTCGNLNSEAHHEPLVKGRGGSSKCPDSQTIPLCRGCHILRGIEGQYSFWEARELNPKTIIIDLLCEYVEQFEAIDCKMAIIDFLTERIVN